MTSRQKYFAGMRMDALDIFQKGLAAVDPSSCIHENVELKQDLLTIGGTVYDLNRFRRIYILGAGKASAAMAGALENILGDKISAGVIITKYGHGVTLKQSELYEAGHPTPDANGAAATQKLLGLAGTADKNTLVINLISGGGSALLAAPAKGLYLSDKQKTNDILLGCGASIHQINTIRKHLSLIKGGLLAKAVYPATLVNLVISDVVDNDLSTISSGPAVPDMTTFGDCLDIIRQFSIQTRLPEPVVAYLKQGTKGKIAETPKPGEHFFSNVTHHIIADNFKALFCANEHAEKLGYDSVILSSMMEGNTIDAAKFHCAIAKQVLKTGHPLKPPACILSGGETTVVLKGKGKGGRNQEFALACAPEIHDCGSIVILSCGTDGTDGPTDANGAVVDSHTQNRAMASGLDYNVHLLENNAYPFFERLNDLVKTGPTHTNVMDIKIMLVR